MEPILSAFLTEEGRTKARERFSYGTRSYQTVIESEAAMYSKIVSEMKGYVFSKLIKTEAEHADFRRFMAETYEKNGGFYRAGEFFCDDTREAHELRRKAYSAFFELLSDAGK